jgi:hypothetical protein
LVKVGSIPTRATTYTFLPTSTFSTYFSIAFAFPMITIRFNGFVPDLINTLITKGGTHVRLGEFVEWVSLCFTDWSSSEFFEQDGHGVRH